MGGVTDQVRIEQLEDRSKALREEMDALAERMVRLEGLHSEGESWDTPTFARFLGVSTQTMKRMARDGEVPFHRIGTRIRFTPADRAAFLAKTVGVPGLRPP